MSVVSVQPKDFILALFIRDDGERFLLGDKGYDFTDSQLHFSANTIENDEVEKQGVDGTMLAGQVRRASVQTFDGYVGDATTPKEEIEQMRREFIAFFAKNHHFRVIYVDCNRNAWQRKGGYLVDAPEVKELWQIHPEYHVGLNFEDVNYYEYDENAEGQEILANIMKVPISSAVEGGLVWDEDGAVSEDATVIYDGDTATASGTSITIADAVEAPLSDFKLKGNTSQQTYTGKNLLKYPYKDTTVTRNNVTFTVNSDGSIATSGTASAETLFWLTNDTWAYNTNNIVVPAGTYTINKTGKTYIAIYVTAYGETQGQLGTYNATTSDTTFTVSEKSSLTVRLRVVSGANTGGFAYSPQLESGSSATSFEPYVGGIPAPNPDYPQAVQTVTGENVVKISDGQGNEQSYTIDLGSTELCKIAGTTYQDSIYKNLTDNKWYVHKEINKTTLTGAMYWGSDSGGRYYTTAIDDYAGSNNILFSSHFVGNTNVASMGSVPDNTIAFNQNNATPRLYIGRYGIWANSDALKTWLNSNSPSVYYALATPNDTEITDAALIAQLEAILSQGKTYAGTNNITTVIPAGNEQGELEITYYTTYEAKVVGGGYVWEEGGSGGPTVIVNESISAVSPVWTVYGPALNPQLENATNGDVIEYVGLIAEGQTLVIDMGEQTAKLDGLNVISNVTGDFISLESGANTLLYSAGNDAPESEIGWSEIVG